jgi:hypothetical protein
MLKTCSISILRLRVTCVCPGVFTVVPWKLCHFRECYSNTICLAQVLVGAIELFVSLRNLMVFGDTGVTHNVPCTDDGIDHSAVVKENI